VRKTSPYDAFEPDGRSVNHPWEKLPHFGWLLYIGAQGPSGFRLLRCRDARRHPYRYRVGRQYGPALGAFSDGSDTNRAASRQRLRAAR
jgi:hypothetical protein